MKRFLSILSVLMFASTTITQGATISGTVTDSATGTPISNAIVSAPTFAATFPIDTTQSDGKYTLTDVTGYNNIALITVSAPGYAGKMLSDTLTDTIQTKDFQLAKAQLTKISGIITDTISSSPVSGATVSVLSSTGNKSTTTSSDGAYTIDSIAQGNDKIYISAPGYVFKMDSSNITSSTPVTLNYAIKKNIYFKVSGKVTDSIGGAPIVGLSVVVYNYYTKIDSVSTDSLGQYSLDSAFSGTTIWVNFSASSGYAAKMVQLTGTTNDPQTINIQLPKKVGVLMNKSIVHLRETFSVDAHCIVLENFSIPGEVRLVNAQGQLIMNKTFKAGKSMTIHFDKRLPPGAYVLKIKQATGLFSRQIIIR